VGNKQLGPSGPSWDRGVQAAVRRNPGRLYAGPVIR